MLRLTVRLNCSDMFSCSRPTITRKVNHACLRFPAQWLRNNTVQANCRLCFITQFPSAVQRVFSEFQLFVVVFCPAILLFWFALTFLIEAVISKKKYTCSTLNSRQTQLAGQLVNLVKHVAATEPDIGVNTGLTLIMWPETRFQMRLIHV